MAVGGVGGVSGLNALAQAYRTQLTSGLTPGVQPGATPATGGPTSAAATRGADFGSAVGDSLRNVGALDRSAADKAVQAATGDLKDVHDYTMAANRAQVATELTTTVRNKALEAFNDIMRMPL